MTRFEKLILTGRRRSAGWPWLIRWMAPPGPGHLTSGLEGPVS
jgi:hypothetical protein